MNFTYTVVALMVGLALALFDYLSARLQLTHAKSVAFVFWLGSVSLLVGLTALLFNTVTALSACLVSILVELGILAYRRYQMADNRYLRYAATHYRDVPDA